jgi:hypothetical protein
MPAFVAWRAGSTNRVVFVIPARLARNRFLVPLKGLQIRALYSWEHTISLRFVP